MAVWNDCASQYTDKIEAVIKDCRQNFDKIKTVMPDLLKALDELKADWTHPQAHEVSYGKKYAKITHDGSAYAFIDAEGNIYMPANWKAPAKHVRGSIFDENFSIGKAFGKYGVAYLR